MSPVQLATYNSLEERTVQDYQRFQCKNCHSRFNEKNGNPFNFFEYPTDLVLLFVRRIIEFIELAPFAMPVSPLRNGAISAASRRFFWRAAHQDRDRLPEYRGMG